MLLMALRYLPPLLHTDLLSDEFGLSLSTFAISLGIFCGIAWCVYRLAKRSRFAGSFVLILLSCLALSSAGIKSARNAVARLDKAKHREAAQAEIDSILEASRNRQREQFEKHGYFEGDQETTSDLLRFHREQARKTSNPQTAAVHRASARYLAELEAAGRAFEAAVNDFAELGGTQPDGLQTLDGIAEREASLDRFEVANSEVLTLLRDRRAFFRRLLHEEGTNQITIRAAMADLDSSEVSNELAIQLRESDSRYVQVAREQFAFFREHPGSWTLESDGTVIFDETVPDEVIEQLSALYIREGECIAEQELLQRKLLEAQGALAPTDSPAP